MVTRINITVKDGKVTWLHQEGDELPNWEDVAASICNAIENNKHYHKPFNDDTKHLLGTTDMCDEQYINW